MSNGHFTLDELRSCARGDDAELIDRVVEHCRECQDCGAQLAAMMALLSHSGYRFSGGLGASLRSRRTLRILVPVAAVIVAIALAILLSRGGPAPVIDERLAALATTEPIPERNVRFQIDALQPLSGAANVNSRALAAGVAMARGEYAAALANLEALHEVVPQSRLATCYLGVARYLSGYDDTETAWLLAAAASYAETDDSLAAHCRWYFANFLLRNGRTAEAVEVLTLLEPADTRIGRLARQLLAEIESAETRR